MKRKDNQILNLKSFKPQDKLESKIWIDDSFSINKKVAKKLLQIANDFWEFTEISWVSPKKVILIGSICSYNWSKYSDIDLHLVVDFKKVDKEVDFVKDYFDTKKNTWNSQHSNLKVFGYNVELYVQDINEEPQSSGIFDLTNEKWLNKPSKNEDAEQIIVNKKSEVKRKVIDYISQIEGFKKKLKGDLTKGELTNLQSSVDSLLKKLRNGRQKSLAGKDGEYGVDNLVYKCLRRMGYIETILDLSPRIYDKKNSILEFFEYNVLDTLLNEGAGYDGNSTRNPYSKIWKEERNRLKQFIVQNGRMMASKENGKVYKVYYEQAISELVGVNYVLCLQYDPLTLEEGDTVYIRALDKFTELISR